MSSEKKVSMGSIRARIFYEDEKIKVEDIANAVEPDDCKKYLEFLSQFFDVIYTLSFEGIHDANNSIKGSFELPEEICKKLVPIAFSDLKHLPYSRKSLVFISLPYNLYNTTFGDKDSYRQFIAKVNTLTTLPVASGDELSHVFLENAILFRMLYQMAHSQEEPFSCVIDKSGAKSAEAFLKHNQKSKFLLFNGISTGISIYKPYGELTTSFIKTYFKKKPDIEILEFLATNAPEDPGQSYMVLLNYFIDPASNTSKFEVDSIRNLYEKSIKNPELSEAICKTFGKTLLKLHDESNKQQELTTYYPCAKNFLSHLTNDQSFYLRSLERQKTDVHLSRPQLTDDNNDTENLKLIAPIQKNWASNFVANQESWKNKKHYHNQEYLTFLIKAYEKMYCYGVSEPLSNTLTSKIPGKKIRIENKNLHAYFSLYLSFPVLHQLVIQYQACPQPNEKLLYSNAYLNAKIDVNAIDDLGRIKVYFYDHAPEIKTEIISLVEKITRDEKAWQFVPKEGDLHTQGFVIRERAGASNIFDALIIVHSAEHEKQTMLKLRTLGIAKQDIESIYFANERYLLVHEKGVDLIRKNAAQIFSQTRDEVSPSNELTDNFLDLSDKEGSDLEEDDLYEDDKGNIYSEAAFCLFNEEYEKFKALETVKNGTFSITSFDDGIESGDNDFTTAAWLVFNKKANVLNWVEKELQQEFSIFNVKHGIKQHTKKTMKHTLFKKVVQKNLNEIPSKRDEDRREDNKTQPKRSENTLKISDFARQQAAEIMSEAPSIRYSIFAYGMIAQKGTNVDDPLNWFMSTFEEQFKHFIEATKNKTNDLFGNQVGDLYLYSYSVPFLLRFYKEMDLTKVRQIQNILGGEDFLKDERAVTYGIKGHMEFCVNYYSPYAFFIVGIAQDISVKDAKNSDFLKVYAKIYQDQGNANFLTDLNEGQVCQNGNSLTLTAALCKQNFRTSLELLQDQCQHKLILNDPTKGHFVDSNNISYSALAAVCIYTDISSEYYQYLKNLSKDFNVRAPRQGVKDQKGNNFSLFAWKHLEMGKNNPKETFFRDIFRNSRRKIVQPDVIDCNNKEFSLDEWKGHLQKYAANRIEQNNDVLPKKLPPKEQVQDSRSQQEKMDNLNNLNQAIKERFYFADLQFTLLSKKNMEGAFDLILSSQKENHYIFATQQEIFEEIHNFSSSLWSFGKDGKAVFNAKSTPPSFMAKTIKASKSGYERALDKIECSLKSRYIKNCFSEIIHPNFFTVEAKDSEIHINFLEDNIALKHHNVSHEKVIDILIEELIKSGYGANILTPNYKQITLSSHDILVDEREKIINGFNEEIAKTINYVPAIARAKKEEKENTIASVTTILSGLNLSPAVSNDYSFENYKNARKKFHDAIKRLEKTHSYLKDPTTVAYSLIGKLIGDKRQENNPRAGIGHGSCCVLPDKAFHAIAEFLTKKVTEEHPMHYWLSEGVEISPDVFDRKVLSRVQGLLGGNNIEAINIQKNIHVSSDEFIKGKLQSLKDDKIDSEHALFPVLNLAYDALFNFSNPEDLDDFILNRDAIIDAILDNPKMFAYFKNEYTRYLDRDEITRKDIPPSAENTKVTPSKKVFEGVHKTKA